ncbi:MAG TPA: MBL fold metallo-hydrolase [Gaiellales bacterium]|nr:MBL fold metallo-hydrolase [Gaiellales bacterium]
MEQLREGIWRWEARHPSWSEDDGGPDGWGPEVASYAIEAGGRLLLVDPLAVPSYAEQLASGCDTAIVLTCPWHERDARALGERLGLPIYVPPPDDGEGEPTPGTVYAAGEVLPGGAQAFPGIEPNDLVLWIEERRALVLGDTLVDRGEGLEIPLTWLRAVTLAEVLATLRPLLDLPVELVLPTHGPPADRAALVRAIS